MIIFGQVIDQIISTCEYQMKFLHFHLTTTRNYKHLHKVCQVWGSFYKKVELYVDRTFLSNMYRHLLLYTMVVHDVLHIIKIWRIGII